MKKYKVGDKVRLLPYKRMQHLIRDNNDMLARAGSVVTLRAEWIIYDNGVEQYFYIEEDQYETHCNKLPGWIWSSDLFEGKVELNIDVSEDELFSLLT